MCLNVSDRAIMICQNCGYQFAAEDADYYYDPSTGWHEWDCPRCGDSHIAEANECMVCGDHTLNDMICDDCHEWVREELQHLSFKVLGKVDISELIDVLNDVVDRDESEKRKRQKPKLPPISNT